MKEHVPHFENPYRVQIGVPPSRRQYRSNGAVLDVVTRIRVIGPLV